MPLTVLSPSAAASMPAVALEPSRLPAVDVGALYVHVPFCFHKCHYCDFYSITRQTEERMSAFVDRMLREAAMWASGVGPTLRPRTIFFGGGTPSLLPPPLMRRLIAGLRGRFDFSRVDEFTVECNPATVDAGYLALLREAGVDRLSFGAQSFRASELKTLERHHDPDDVGRSLDLARAAGFERLNLDLIFAIPGQSMEDWRHTLATGLSLGTSHLSCYGLTYEPNTPIAVKKRLGHLTAVEETLELQMLHETRRTASAAGMPPYEISNYAAPGQACRHNVNYWTGGDYLALGPSAASHVRGWRWRNRPHLGEWERAVDAGTLPAIDVETLDPAARARERMMLSLRLADGIDVAAFAARTGVDPLVEFSDTIDRFAGAGLLEVTAQHVRLTERGIDVADALASEFLAS